MTAQIIQLRDHQTQEQAERARKALEDHQIEEARIMNEALFGIPHAGLIDYDPRFWPGTNPREGA